VRRLLGRERMERSEKVIGEEGRGWRGGKVIGEEERGWN